MTAQMTHRECFLKVMAGKPTDWVPNYELALWGQTIDRWIQEGMPQDQVYLGDWFEGESLFRLDRRAFARLNIGMLPAFDYEELEETERYLIARHPNVVITKALK